MLSAQQAYEELSYYTLAHPSPEFIHQYVVDAYTAQTADDHTKPIALTFALVGLYLHVEKGYTGREVQLIHTQLAAGRRAWPAFERPRERGELSVADVLAVPAGPERDAKLDAWCASVWKGWNASREQVIAIRKGFP